jgi:hypothetical protein
MDPRMRVASVHSGRKGVRVAVFVLLASLLLAWIPVLATTVKHLGLKDIVGASDAIVAGRVESTRSFWRGKQIYTEVGLAVSRVLKGPREERLTFLQAGGRVESPVPLEMTVPGSPIFPVGDEAYFFLQAGNTGERYVVGLFQGHVPLRHDVRGDFVVFGGARRSPAEFEELIRREMAGQKHDTPGRLR